MRAVVQRVGEASVSVDDAVLSQIGPGLCVLLGVAKGDTDEDAQWMVEKLCTLRIFADDEEKLDRSIQDVNGEVLVVSQFTLFADTTKGRRPSFFGAADSFTGKRVYEDVVARLRANGLIVLTGEFGAHMSVSLTNDGPVTILLDSPPHQK